MKLPHRADEHARFRALLAMQLDEPLALDEAWALDVHLTRCDRCRAAERDLREQRRLLHGLATLTPPRDLGARVSAALDREVLRHPPRSGEVLWPSRQLVDRPGVGATSVVVSLAVLMVGGMAVLGGLPAPRPDPTRLRPTPLAVPEQALAYLGAGPNGLAVYRTSVDQVCPLTAIDCVAPSEDDAPLLALSRPMRPNSLALSPSGERLVISGRDAETTEDFFAIVVMPPTVTATPAPAPPTSEVGPASPPAQTAELPTDAAPSSDTPPSEPAPADTSVPVASLGTATPDVTPVEPTPSATTALTLLAILEDVRGTGAAPAWSPAGDMLAFSAMPADGSHGPDLYLWQPGDQTARAVTFDHATYFASWSGGWVVVSRVSSEPPAAEATGEEVAEPPAPVVETLLIDPASGQPAAVDGPPLWLPQVNGPRTHAVAWQGTLAWAGATVQPAAGALYLLDWRALDPFAGTDGPVVSDGDQSPLPTAADPSPSPDASATSVPGQGGPGSPPAPPTARPSALLTLPPIDGSPSGKPAPGGSGSPSPVASAAPDQTPDVGASPPESAVASPAESPGSEPSPWTAVLMALEPSRDATAQPVLDWEVRWAPDGSALGFWIADVPGASWGRLAVVPLDMATGQLGLDTPLLPTTLARRSFTLGHNRVAWIGPAESTPDGELRISAWGPDGSGVLRFSAPELHGVLAAF